MVDAPAVEEVLCAPCIKLWASIARQFHRDAEGCEERAQVTNKARRSGHVAGCIRSEYLHPAGEPIADDEIVTAP